MKSLILTLLIGLFAVTSQAQKGYSELSGYVTSNNRPVKGVTITIGAYGLLTDGNGYFKFPFIRPGNVQVRVSPPNKRPRIFTVFVSGQPTKRNFPIDW